MNTAALHSRIGAELRENSIAYLFVLPSVALVLAVVVYPIYFVADFSLHRSVVFTRDAFVGLDNYTDLLDARVLRNVAASLIFVVGSIVLATSAGLGLALVLNRKFALRTTLRTVIFVPWVTSQVASALIWRWLVNPDYSPVTSGLRAAGLPRIDFLGDPTLAMAVLIFTNVWHSVAFAMIVILAGLQTIPDSVRRSAAVDGASSWLSFRHVTLPMIMPSLLVCVMMSSFSYFNIIAIPLELTGGGPQSATELVTLRMYFEAFSFFNVGFASALTMLILALNVMLTLAYLRIPGGKGFMQ
jgi:multiple sugar transport system permease protein